MMTDLSRPVVLASFPDSLQASILVNLLGGAGIQSRLVGDYTSGFRAEAPADVQLLVSAGDFDTAKNLLVRWLDGNEETPVDWSQVDVGDSSRVSEREREFEEATQAADSTIQFSVSSMILIQGIAALFAAVLASMRGEGAFAYVFGLGLVLAIPVGSLIGILKITQSGPAQKETGKMMLILWMPTLLILLLFALV